MWKWFVIGAVWALIFEVLSRFAKNQRIASLLEWVAIGGLVLAILVDVATFPSPP